MPLIPDTNTPGLFLTSKGDGLNSSVWSATGNTIRISVTYAVQNLIAVPSGATNFLPQFFVPVPVGQTVTFIGVRATVRGGTSATMNIQQNGSTITGLSGLVVTTSPTTTTATNPTAVAADDYFAPVVTAISGTPDGLSLSFYFDVSA